MKYLAQFRRKDRTYRVFLSADGSSVTLSRRSTEQKPGKVTTKPISIWAMFSRRNLLAKQVMNVLTCQGTLKFEARR